MIVNVEDGTAERERECVLLFIAVMKERKSSFVKSFPLLPTCLQSPTNNGGPYGPRGLTCP